MRTLAEMCISILGKRGTQYLFRGALRGLAGFIDTTGNKIGPSLGLSRCAQTPNPDGEPDQVRVLAWPAMAGAVT